MYECFTCRYYVCCIPVWDSQRPENGWRILRLESNRRLWVLNVLLTAEHLSSPLIWFFRTGFMQSMLTLNFQCSWGWPWSPDSTASTLSMLRLQVCTTTTSYWTPNCFWRWKPPLLPFCQMSYSASWLMSIMNGDQKGALMSSHVIRHTHRWFPYLRSCSDSDVLSGVVYL